MANHAQAATNSSTAGGIRSEIVGKWSRFSDAEVAALKTNDDLIAQVQSKYSLDKAAAQKEVDAFTNGRRL